MIIDRISVSKSVEALGEWNKGALEAQLEPGENPTDCFNQLRSMMDDLLPSINMKRGDIPTIDRSVERRKILMDDCKTIGELAKWKPKPDDSEEIRSYYMNRLKQLTEKIK